MLYSFYQIGRGDATPINPNISQRLTDDERKIKMATFKQYELKNGTKKWLFKTYLGIDEVTGKQLQTTRRNFNTRKEAVLAEKRLQYDVLENGFNKKKIVTFGELYNLWIDQYRLSVKPSTVAAANNHAKRQILPIFKDIKLNKLSVSFCQTTVNEWRSKYKSYSYLRLLVNQVLKHGVSLEIIESNPMGKTTLPRKKEAEKKLNYYSKEELQNFLLSAKKISDPKIFIFFRLIAYTGMRKSEALALQWKDINFDKQQLTIGKTLSVDEHGKVIVQTPKTATSARTISLDDGTVQILREWRREQKKRYFVLGRNTSNIEQFIFTTADNNFFTPSITQWWMESVYKRTDLRKITVHGFRHTHCSLLFESGASLQEVQERLGHRDIKTTMNIYTHVTEKTIKRTGDIFANYMES